MKILCLAFLGVIAGLASVEAYELYVDIIATIKQNALVDLEDVQSLVTFVLLTGVSGSVALVAAFYESVYQPGR